MLFLHALYVIVVKYVLCHPFSVVVIHLLPALYVICTKYVFCHSFAVGVLQLLQVLKVIVPKLVIGFFLVASGGNIPEFYATMIT